MILIVSYWGEGKYDLAMWWKITIHIEHMLPNWLSLHQLTLKQLVVRLKPLQFSIFWNMVTSCLIIVWASITMKTLLKVCICKHGTCDDLHKVVHECLPWCSFSLARVAGRGSWIKVSITFSLPWDLTSGKTPIDPVKIGLINQVLVWIGWTHNGDEESTDLVQNWISLSLTDSICKKIRLVNLIN